MENVLSQWLFNPTIGRLVSAVVGIVLVVVLVRFSQRSLTRRIKDTDTRYRARKLLSLGGYLAAAILVLAVYNNRLGGFTVAFGVAGAGVAFALQEVIASVAGWFAVTFANFYSTGDRVQLGGIKGDVIDIGVLRTALMEIGEWVKGDLYTGRVVRIANSFVFKEPVFNFSGEFPFLWDEITLPVKYGSDWRLARELLERVANELLGEYARQATAAWQEMVNSYLIEDARVSPIVTLVANDNWIEFTIRFVVHYRQRRAMKDRLFTRILEEIEKTDGRVSLASATFQLVDSSVIDVRLKNR